MSHMSRYFAPVFVSVGAAATIAAAPIALADPALPTPGSENAADTIEDLKGLGYDVQLNYEHGRFADRADAHPPNVTTLNPAWQ